MSICVAQFPYQYQCAFNLFQPGVAFAEQTNKKKKKEKKNKKTNGWFLYERLYWAEMGQVCAYILLKVTEKNAYQSKT